MKRRIRVGKDTTFIEFKCRIRTTFTSEEISTRQFRVYRFPHNFTDIGQRLPITSETEFQECMGMFTNPDDFPPELYVWNYEGESPTKIPTQIPELEAKGDLSSVVSRDSNQSKLCKKRDENTCLCCGFFGADGFGMKCCHLYEIKAHARLKSAAAKDRMLKSLKLLDVNDLHNLMTMCEKCHAAFDSHKIGIHPTDLRWIVTTAQREVSAPSALLYSEIHGKRVVFSEPYFPPQAVLDDRMTHFVAKNKHAKDSKKTTHYCHFCPQTYKGKGGLEEKDAHVPVCKLLSDVAGLKV